MVLPHPNRLQAGEFWDFTVFLLAYSIKFLSYCYINYLYLFLINFPPLSTSTLFCKSHHQTTKNPQSLRFHQKSTNLKCTMPQDEKDYTVWRNLNFNLTSILLLLQGTTAHQPFQQFLINLFKPTFEHIGWNPKEREGLFEI